MYWLIGITLILIYVACAVINFIFMITTAKKTHRNLRKRMYI